jgi:hypothetical protein
LKEKGKQDDLILFNFVLICLFVLFFSLFQQSCVNNKSSENIGEELIEPNPEATFPTIFFGQDLEVFGGAGINIISPPIQSNAGGAIFGFIQVPKGFGFLFTGTDFEDNIVIWTDQNTFATNFFVEWVDNPGTWHSLSGSVTAGDIINEATDRGLVPGDFAGFFIKGLGGDDMITADGSGSIWTLPGSPRPPAIINDALLGQHLEIDGGGGSDIVAFPPTQSFETEARFGFVAWPETPAFRIIGTDFDDNIVIWMNPVTGKTNFAIEWVNGLGEWDSLVGSVSAGEIADYLQDRGAAPEEFSGFIIDALGGDDRITADGSGSFGVFSGSVISKNEIDFPFCGQDLIIYGNAGIDTVFPPPDSYQESDIYSYYKLGIETGYGFVDVFEDFAFQITGSDFDDNIIIWRNPVTLEINFAVEWVDDEGSWGSLIGSVSEGEIADEAEDRGLGAGDFAGFFIEALDGDDRITADGSSSFGILPGSIIALPQ